jgi:hypothetical protein
LPKINLEWRGAKSALQKNGARWLKMEEKGVKWGIEQNGGSA